MWEKSYILDLDVHSQWWFRPIRRTFYRFAIKLCLLAHVCLIFLKVVAEKRRCRHESWTMAVIIICTRSSKTKKWRRITSNRYGNKLYEVEFNSFYGGSSVWDDSLRSSSEGRHHHRHQPFTFSVSSSFNCKYFSHKIHQQPNNHERTTKHSNHKQTIQPQQNVILTSNYF
jgi:hypothetical protein